MNPFYYIGVAGKMVCKLNWSCVTHAHASNEKALLLRLYLLLCSLRAECWFRGMHTRLIWLGAARTGDSPVVSLPSRRSHAKDELSAGCYTTNFEHLWRIVCDFRPRNAGLQRQSWNPCHQWKFVYIKNKLFTYTIYSKAHCLPMTLVI